MAFNHLTLALSLCRAQLQILTQSHEIGNFTIPILQMRKLRYRDIKETCPRSHSEEGRKSSSLAPAPTPLKATPGCLCRGQMPIHRPYWNEESAQCPEGTEGVLQGELQQQRSLEEERLGKEVGAVKGRR